MAYSASSAASSSSFDVQSHSAVTWTVQNQASVTHDWRFKSPYKSSQSTRVCRSFSPVVLSLKGNLRSIIIEEDTARRGAKGSGAMASKKKSKKEKKEKKEKSKSKKKRSRREPSSSSSSSSDSESENSEEVRAHRAAKMAKKLAARLKQGEIAGYTDNVNPFGDANLTERFVWHKKIEKSLVAGVDPKELGLKAEKRRHEERLK